MQLFFTSKKVLCWYTQTLKNVSVVKKKKNSNTDNNIISNNMSKYISYEKCDKIMFWL